MVTHKSMKCDERIFEKEAICCHVATYPVGSNTEVTLAVVVGPYVSCERNFADSTLGSRSYYE